MTYAPVSGGRDATITLTGIKVKAVTHNLPILGSLTCYYGGTLTASAYNPENSSRPDTSVNQAQGKLDGAALPKISSGSSPDTATVTASFQLVGETTPGTFGQTLFVTS